MGKRKRKADYTPEEWAALLAKHRASQKTYYARNKERIAEKKPPKKRKADYSQSKWEELSAKKANADRAYYLANRDAVLARVRARASAKLAARPPKPEISRLTSQERNRRWREKHRDAINASGRLYYAKNKEKAREATRKWSSSPRGAASISNAFHKRRAKMYSGCSAADFREWRDSAEKVCFYCKEDCPIFHVDHYMPLALGGEHEIHNLRIACPTCNQRKNALHPDVFLARMRAAA